ncbi:phage tail protein [Flavivirga algicola]|uniref:Phage tail protein n=1 Tax=Flavivirga algicola TaxID=2729136 RepID=A0ABX1S1I3_9FLAO|nr:tail fiber protein [Flavivirga algicola]NMH89211.1 phage tail protein [Flavivirga algicola]
MDGTIGEIRIFAGNFAPRAWAFCQGQLLSINSNQALFSILGTTYGGDGRTSFGLPDLRGRVPIGPGTGPGLTTRRQGQRSGTEYNILTIPQMPSHNHNAIVTNPGEIAIPVNTTSGDEDEANPGAGVLANTGNDHFASSATTGAKYAGSNIPVAGEQITITNTGANQSVNNMQPWLSTYYIICLQGVFPSRN